MRKIIIIFILWMIASQGFAQDTLGQVPVVAEPPRSLVAPPRPVVMSQESYLTRHLKFFEKRTEVPDVVVEGEELAPIFEGVDSIFQERLESINTLMHLPYNERVRAYIEVYITKKRSQTRVMLALSKYYFPIFEKELQKHGLPEELKYLAIIESALNPRALSPAGAGGLWQFMYRTGRMYGLKVDKELDERFDVEKATAAAALYLKYLHNLYDDWTLAIAAYNCGPGTVNRAIKRAKNKRDYWEIYNYLPRETRGYVPAFIGATYAMTYYREHGITLSETDFPEICDTLVVDRKLYFERIAKFTDAPIQTIRDYNPQYKADIIPAGEQGQFMLKLPANYILKFIEYSDSIYANPIIAKDSTPTELITANEQQKGPLSKITYRVKRGDNLSLIAVRFDVKVDQLMEWNDLQSDVLKINQSLTVYTTKSNVRDMSEVVAVQNAEKAKAAELAAANQPTPKPKPAANPQAQKPASNPQPKQAAATQTKPATTQTKPATTTTAQSKPATAQAKPAMTTTTTAVPKKPATQQNVVASTTRTTRPTTVVPARTQSKPTTAVTPKAAPSKTIPLKSATGKMQTSNVAVLQSKNAKSEGSRFVYYRVRSGETLFSIQRKHPGSNIQEIINMNSLRDNGNKIYPNQVLKIRVN